jgi:hypothetical protein
MTVGADRPIATTTTWDHKRQRWKPTRATLVVRRQTFLFAAIANKRSRLVRVGKVAMSTIFT